MSVRVRVGEERRGDGLWKGGCCGGRGKRGL